MRKWRVFPKPVTYDDFYNQLCSVQVIMPGVEEGLSSETIQMLGGAVKSTYSTITTTATRLCSEVWLCEIYNIIH